MPSWLQGVATYQPATPLIDSVRALLDGATPGNSLPAAVAWCLGILLAAILWARWVFARNAGRR
jgi:ABC-2 type transport system permease protein